MTTISAKRILPDRSPAVGTYKPDGGRCSGNALAWNCPKTMMRSHSSGNIFASISRDNGSNWYILPSQPNCAPGGGLIALSADAKSIVWVPADAPVSQSSDGGASWASCSGIPIGLKPVSDPNADPAFYALDKTSGTTYKRTDGGGNLWIAAVGLPTLDNREAGGRLMAVAGQPDHLCGWFRDNKGPSGSTKGPPVSSPSTAWTKPSWSRRPTMIRSVQLNPNPRRNNEQKNTIRRFGHPVVRRLRHDGFKTT